MRMVSRAAAKRWESLAERFRAHREAFALALELGCTPAEADAELARRAAKARWQDSTQRLHAIKARANRRQHIRAVHQAALAQNTPHSAPAAPRCWWQDL